MDWFNGIYVDIQRLTLKLMGYIRISGGNP